MQPAVYLLASRDNGTLYVGVTSHLLQRVWQHREDLAEGFSKTYGVHRLVWFELHATMEEAIRREKQIKKWNRAWKIRLIEENNRLWLDLYDELTGQQSDMDSRLRGNDE
jgi:putative endonuclease